MVLKPGKKIALTEEDKEAQRQRIMQAAVKVFGKQGYHRSTITQIAQTADMGRGTLYWYFKSKEDLFREVILQFMHGSVQQLQEMINQEDSLEQTLRKIIRSWLDMAVEQPEYVHIMYSIYSHHAEGELAHELLSATTELYRQIIAFLEALFQKAIHSGQMRSADSYRLSRLMIGLIDGIVLQHLFVEPIQPEAMTEVVLGLMLKGLRPEAGDSRPGESRDAE